MTRIVVECADPNNPKAVEIAIEDMIGKCNITYFKQAEKMKEAGKVKSDREAARKIAKDTGETESTVRHRIQKGCREVAQGGPLNQPQSKSISKPEPRTEILTKQDKTFILNQAKAIKTEHRKERVQVREQQKQEVIQKAPPLDGDKYRLILSEFQKIEIKDGSIDAIITDPPYGFDYLPLYKDLSNFASRVLEIQSQKYIPTFQERKFISGHTVHTF